MKPCMTLAIILDALKEIRETRGPREFDVICAELEVVSEHAQTLAGVKPTINSPHGPVAHGPVVIDFPSILRKRTTPGVPDVTATHRANLADEIRRSRKAAR